MWQDWVNWYRNYRPDKITAEDVQEQLKTNVAFIHGKDKNGYPMMIIQARNHVPKACSPESFVKYALFYVE